MVREEVSQGMMRETAGVGEREVVVGEGVILWNCTMCCDVWRGCWFISPVAVFIRCGGILRFGVCRNQAIAYRGTWSDRVVLRMCDGRRCCERLPENVISSGNWRSFWTNLLVESRDLLRDGPPIYTNITPTQPFIAHEQFHPPDSDIVGHIAVVLP